VGREQITDGNIGPADIHQGALGDCYFLSALRWVARLIELD
jgi:hypothetical protein